MRSFSHVVVGGGVETRRGDLCADWVPVGLLTLIKATWRYACKGTADTYADASGCVSSRPGAS